MSMGFMQWTIKYTDQYNPDGKLQRLIQRVPEAFQRYKIELDTSSRYKIPAGGGKYYEPIAIKGAGKPDNLRGLDWAKRFYAAGLDPDIIVEEVKLALEVIEESKKRITKKVGNSYIPYYEKSTALRALIQETFNNRPAYLYIALQRAITRAKKTGEVNTDKFFEMVQEAIRDVYGEKEPENGPKKAGNLIQKTARI